MYITVIKSNYIRPLGLKIRQESWLLLSLATKLKVYNSLVLSVLLYGCETWTILKSDERRLEAFHMSCQRRILRIRWFDHVTNADVVNQTGQEDLGSHILRRRMAVFGHARRLPEEAPGRAALRLTVDTRTGRRPDNNPCWSGSVNMGDHDIPGSVRWRSLLESLTMMHGTLPPIAVNGGQ